MSNRLLFSLQPYNDELLSSWLMRLCMANHTSIVSLLSSGFPKKYYHDKYIDIYDFPEEFFIWLTTRSGVSVQKIKSLTLLSFEGYVEEKINRLGKHHWIAPKGTRPTPSDKLKYYSIRFCPECLKERPYYRREWALLFVNACEKHGCYFENRCPNCGLYLAPHFLNEHDKITDCFHCGYDLSKTKPRRLRTKGSFGMTAISELKQIMKDGYYLLDGKWHYSFGLFFVLRIVVKNLMRLGFQNEAFWIESEWDTLEDKKRKLPDYLEYLDPKEVYVLVSVAYWLIKEWPVRYLEFCKANRLSNEHRIFDKYRLRKKEMPFWFTEIPTNNTHSNISSCKAYGIHSIISLKSSIR